MIVELIKEKMQKEGLSARAAALEAHVAHTTVLRAIEGRNLDLPSLNKICTWLGVSVADALSEGGAKDEVLASKMSLLISREPKLKALFEELVSEVEAGTLNSSDVEDIVAYAGYRIKQKKG
ncbi:MAG: hypothetical protein CVU42_07605 [Chloroflexi bacterium HGW-Chloroflexi-4]|jgi:transcriptional regulator with XRE-family HTH domain|nr:MAG: hypothetical protein CVU42_07605 [Chloroflexi bacterium HGW-Chloroflexi-4]